MKTVFLAMALGFWACPSFARAADVPPCGTAREVTWAFRWQAPADAGTAPIQGYRLYRHAPGGAFGESFTLKAGAPGADGILQGTSIAFANDQAWVVAVTAWSADGESERSNEITIPVQVRACTPPGKPTLLERVDALLQGLQELRDELVAHPISDAWGEKGRAVVAGGGLRSDQGSRVENR